MSFVAGFSKTAQISIDGGSLGGAMAAASGFFSGQAAGHKASKVTAGHLSRKGYKTRNEETAATIGKVTAPIGALIGLGASLKHRRKIGDFLAHHISKHPDMSPLYHYGIPLVGGTLGGIGAGAATGGLMSLRGAFSKKKQERK